METMAIALPSNEAVKGSEQNPPDGSRNLGLSADPGGFSLLFPKADNQWTVHYVTNNMMDIIPTLASSIFQIIRHC
jgi:hypothetical protein